jgi:hypothetical protein
MICCIASEKEVEALLINVKSCFDIATEEEKGWFADVAKNQPEKYKKMLMTVYIDPKFVRMKAG